MKATALEFRFRYLIHAIIYLIGFIAPWNYALHLDSVRTWQFLAAWPARSGWINFSVSTITVLLAGALCALLAASIRTWGSAYLGTSVVKDGAMHGDRIVASGPYRHLRNPLYLGTFIHTLALALLMPPTGAIFTILAIGIEQLRLIGGEESFLTAGLGDSYRDYYAKVPRLLPSLTPLVPDSEVHPHWGTGFLGEIYFWGAFLSFATLGWRYNALLIIQGVVVSLGLSFVARAFVPQPETKQ
jgi:protein-S-isoprenylcysteine O-methyltransferase Ste14